ncbi:MAG: recombinase RarA, partial [Treponema sp.]|nr:recombinase RarA [Treponema sp.]
FKSENHSGENLTFSPVDNARESALDKADKQWRNRLDSNKAETLLDVRDTMVSMAHLLRHHRSLVWNADDGLLLWEVARKTPEGVTCGVCRTQKGREILEQYGRTLGDLDKPILQYRPETANATLLSPEDFRNLIVQFEYNGAVFDRIFFRDPFASKDSISALARAFSLIAFPKKSTGKVFTDEEDAETSIEDSISYNSSDSKYDDANADNDGGINESPFADDWCAIISQKIPSGGQQISELIKKQILTPATAQSYFNALEKMEEAEKAFFGDKTNPLFSWDDITIKNAFLEAGFEIEATVKETEERRRITPEEIRRWFDTKTSAYGSKIIEKVGAPELQKLLSLLESSASNMIFKWKTKTAYFVVSALKAEGLK